MSSALPAASIGVDFGTSNTVVALATGNGRVEAIRFEHGGTAQSVYTSALCFWQDRPGSGVPPSAEGGPWAIERLLEGRNALRFMQSFKTFAASRTFQSTTIFRQRYQFEDLLAAFLRTLTRHAGTGLDLAAAHVTIGRPVRFAGARPDDALAMSATVTPSAGSGAGHPLRLRAGRRGLFFRPQPRPRRDVLVADFGGGTSDFSIVRFSERPGGCGPSRSATPASASPATLSTPASSTASSRRVSAREVATARSAKCCRCRTTTMPGSRAGMNSPS